MIQDVQDRKRGSGYAAIRKLGESRADKEQRKEFKIPSYIEEGLTSQEAADRLACHFAAISQTVTPLDINMFHPALRQAIERGMITTNKPAFSQHDIYRKLLTIKKPNSSVTGDIPKRLIQEYPYLWAGPTTILFNKIIQNSEWPQT